ncbi:hypothetical protein GTP45_27010 [Pseudoduganella sp. FT55W]|uniref:Uncharacterized protein n=1 Tax=Duganella rivi TaxID=2666083 RepID=A0A7X4GWG3_9BURK|nr:hypothetical protein [Duganella rivi]MYM70430.1 hypothetical protein [Duganella rivi]
MAEINATQMRDALAWVTNDQKTAEDPSTNPWEWFWEAVQGDFNDDRSTGQIVLDAAISMIPLVDQICDVRDLIANCKKLYKEPGDTWAWVALVLTLIGLFPVLGSLVKGVLKVFFAFVRRAGGDHVIKAVDAAMTWVITLLRRREFQKYLHAHKIDEVFDWLAKQIKAVQAKVNTTALLAAFDKAIQSLQSMADKVKYVPVISGKAEDAIEQVKNIRRMAKNGMDSAVHKVDEIFDAIVRRLENEALREKYGILDTANVHFRGALPESSAVALMRNQKTRPTWITLGDRMFDEADPDAYKTMLSMHVRQGWPTLSEQNIKSFHKFVPDEIKGPARLYRIIAPTSGAMGDCWVSEKVFKELQSAADPKAAWRKHLAVWPDWNVNGQFVIYDVKAGETLKVWRGPASSQVKDALPGMSLEGGWEQVIFKVDRASGMADDMRYFKISPGKSSWMDRGIDYGDYSKLTEQQKRAYTSLRIKTNHPNISGPFETGWGYTDFGGKGFPNKIGLPSFPGQTTTLAK